MRFFFVKLTLALLLGVPMMAGPLEDAQVEVLYDQALLAFEKGQVEATVDLLSQALDLSQEDMQVNLLQAVALCSLKRYEEAKTPLKKVLKQDPDNVDAGLNLGIAYFETGRWKDAKKAFEKVLKNAPNHSQARVNLGILALRSEKWEEARRYFGETVRLDEKNIRAWVGLSDALTWLNMNEEAARARRKALALDSSDETVRLKLAGSLYILGKINEVLKTLRGLEYSDQAEAHFLFGIANHRRGHLFKSEASFERALELKADYPAAQINLGITYYDQGIYEKAIAQFKAVLLKHAKNKEAKDNLKVALEVAVGSLTKKGTQAYVAGRYQQAIKIWRRVLAMDAKNKVVKGLMKTVRQRLKGQAAAEAATGGAAFDAGQLTKALRAWNRALDMDPQNSLALAGLAQAAKKPKILAEAYEKEVAVELLRGSFVKARRMGQEVKAVNPTVGKRLLKKIDSAKTKRAKRFILRGDKAQAAKKWRKAWDAYEEALALRPEDSALIKKLNQSRVSLRRGVSQLLKKAAASGTSPAAAYQWYQQALVLDPDNHTARDGARQAAKKAKLVRADPEKVNKIYFEGVYAYANGKTRQAIQLWEKALVMDPKHQQARQAVEEARRKLKAITELDKKS